MAFATGAATNYDDLLDDLKTFLTTNASLVAANQQWTVNADTEVSGVREVYFQGPGLSGNDQIHVNIKRYLFSATGAYNWGIRGATGYDSGSDYDNQPGTATNPAYFCLANIAIDYWFFANGRRFIVIAKIGTVFTSMYAGFYLPYGLPSEIPFPMFIGANSGIEGKLYTETDVEISSFWRSGAILVAAGTDAGSYIRTNDGFWLGIGQFQSPEGDIGRIWPWNVANNSSITVTSVNDYTESPDGSYTVLPAIIYSRSYGTRDIYGELDGVFYAPGVNLNSEDTFTIGADTYTVFQSINRVDRFQFAAILQ